MQFALINNKSFQPTSGKCNENLKVDKKFHLKKVTRSEQVTYFILFGVD